jgi:hypothetical protein
MRAAAASAAIIGVLALGGAAAIAEAGRPSTPETVSVHVPHKLGDRASVHVSFRPGGQLPAGGYYYAVLVLKSYKHYTRQHPPPCATSSNMERADYGYPHPGRSVSLVLAPAPSRSGRWCSGGSYVGAVYAVPQAPPCEARYPCFSEPYEPPSPCWNLEGHPVCGIVAKPPRYRYPDGLPRPLAAGTLIVGRFSVGFR